MKTKEFLKKHGACKNGARWALSISEDMVGVWDAMIEHGKHEWLIWTATRPGVFQDSVLRKLACRFIRETPLHDGRTVWDLLTDERSRKAVEVAEFYANGKATDGELQAARVAAFAALAAVRAATRATVRAATRATVRAAFAARNVARDAGDAAYAAEAAAYDARAAADAAARYADRADAYATDDVADATARAIVRAAARAAYADAKAAQAQMSAELGNPFKERESNENERLFEET